MTERRSAKEAFKEAFKCLAGGLIGVSFIVLLGVSIEWLLERNEEPAEPPVAPAECPAVHESDDPDDDPLTVDGVTLQEARPGKSVDFGSFRVICADFESGTAWAYVESYDEAKSPDAALGTVFDEQAPRGLCPSYDWAERVHDADIENPDGALERCGYFKRQPAE